MQSQDSDTTSWLNNNKNCILQKTGNWEEECTLIEYQSEKHNLSIYHVLVKHIMAKNMVPPCKDLALLSEETNI